MFCTWQDVGKSAESVAHRLKNLANWVPKATVDLRLQADKWPALDRSASHRFIVCDDFVGSGNTLSPLFSHTDAPIPQLLRLHPNSECIAMVVAGMETGLRQAQESIRCLGEMEHRIRVLAEYVFRSEDQCFSSDSRIITDVDARARLRDFCIESMKRTKSSWLKKNPFGYGDTGALTVFSDTVPNTSLPLLWCDDSTWTPLFPGCGRLS